MSKSRPLTPMMAQYRRIRAGLPSDSLLLFRLGDFYELFFEDAQVGASILEIALTKRGEIPMCGIPHHALGNYVGKLLQAGKKVALSEQIKEGSSSKLIERKVTRILSPGAHFDDSLLQASQNNFLAAVLRRGRRAGIGAVELTTGEFTAMSLPADDLKSELDFLAPTEVVYPEKDVRLPEMTAADGRSFSGYEDWNFAEESAEHLLKEHYGVASLDGFGLSGCPEAVGAAGAILHYLSHHLRFDLKHLKTPERRERNDYLELDAVTMRNLEILKPLQSGAPREASLLGVMDDTVTPMGARCLRQWISRPLSRREAIGERQEIIARWLERPQQLERFRETLQEIRDLERSVSRLSLGSGNARDLVVIRLGLEKVPILKEILDSLAQSKDGRLFDQDEVPPTEPTEPAWSAELRGLPELCDLIGRAIRDTPPATIREGGFMCDGFDEHLDELRTAGREGRNWIANLQLEESERTGIPTLKVRYNSVVGYYIEVTRSHLDKVPEDYVRKQTVANGERFVTTRLKEVEGKILGADERAQQWEYELFQKIRETVIQQIESIQRTAAAVARYDALASLAKTAQLHDYCRPEIGEEGILVVEDGRHPVLERSPMVETFVPNDASLGGESPQIALITGPNMAGKSTYIRQIAILSLLAHTGSFVPARRARIDLMDRIFTRIGASDDLSRGQSTFMVEMSETANILNHATERSLIILDEVGRGTSTFDGLSLAWSLVEHLHNRVGAKTFFATHYHELVELSRRLERVGSFQVAVREWNDSIVFVHKIVPGGADRSYGIQVARLAGIPAPVLVRAREILERLERADLRPDGPEKASRSRRRSERERLEKLAPAPQPDLFSWTTE